MTHDEAIASLGDDQSARACERYETELVAEARAIAQGRSRKPPTGEHLRVLLSWLDGPSPASGDESPF